MATTAQARGAPAHLWIVGVLALLWNAFGCYDYVMTESANADYLSQFPPDMLAYWNGVPAWIVGLWALGVWSGLIGATLLLMRSRYSVWAFALSLIGAAVVFGYQLLETQMPPSMTTGAMAIMPWLVVLIAAFQLWYSWTEARKRVLK